MYEDDLEAKPFQPGKAQFVLGLYVLARELVWQNLRRPHKNGHRYDGIGPFTFDRKQYEQALAKLAELG
ncbi:hypothetical protein ACFWNN_34255 [Lentzea sp. NPDC058450]|uniref:hypothetical protein n=1 Tax=Lentzea sp. NPDC058450 TaxID=3346505 RepID=UPI003646FAD4